MLRRILTLIGIGLIAFANAENSEKLDKVQRTLDNIISKAGIQFDGEFKSEYLPSHITGSLANDSTERQRESNEFTSVDFDIKARPNEMIGARVIFRLYENWQNFFSDIANPLFSRWISIDGNIKDMISFNVGDFKQHYSPLTLYTPEVEILNEPYIFARQRQAAEDEFFLGYNNRVLQGINFKIDAEVVPVFNEFHFGLIGTRLRNIETSITNGDKVTPEIQIADMAKYVVGGNLDFTMLKGVNLGGTYLYIFDQKASYKGDSGSVWAKTHAQGTAIYSARPGIDITKIIGTDKINLGINTEFAVSVDDTTTYDSVGYNTSTKKAIKDFSTSNITGSAINLGAVAGIIPSDNFSLKINGAIILNDKDYRNDLAQSPSFFGGRIMNIENNEKQDALMYNTFDGLYHSVFKFCPAAENVNRWAKAPFMKNSYSKIVYTQEELAKLTGQNLRAMVQKKGLTKKDLIGIISDSCYLDPSVQLVMPLGPATPNRVGFDANLSTSFLKDGINIGLLCKSLQENEQVEIKSIVYPKIKYTQLGGGLKIDFSRIATVLKYPLEISGSYVASESNSPEADTIKAFDIKSDFINTGLYFQFWKRTALMLGYQFIQNKYAVGDSTVNVKLGNWAVGLEWKVSDGADVIGSIGQMSRKNSDELGDNYQTIGDVSLRVKF